MDAVLYVCHGSRMKEASEAASQFIQRCMRNISVPIQEHCFLELTLPAVKQGIERCVTRGATRIIVVPILLLTAAHAKKDIPEEIDRVRAKYPGVEFVYGRPFGVDGKIIDILIERVTEKIEISRELDVLLVGRGSSDPNSRQDMEWIATLLREKIDVNSITCCYLAAVEPTVDTALNQMMNRSKQVVVLPYLLFTGVLMAGMQEKVAEAQILIDKEIVLCEYLGYHPKLADLVTERVEELLKEGDIECNIG